MCSATVQQGRVAAERLTTSAVASRIASRPTSTLSLARRPFQIAGRQVFSSACLQEHRICPPYPTLIFGVHYCHIPPQGHYTHWHSLSGDCVNHGVMLISGKTRPLCRNNSLQAIVTVAGLTVTANRESR